MTTVFADSDSDSGSSSTGPTTLGTTTSTVTTVPLTASEASSSTTDTDTTTSDTSTTEELLCNYDTVCDAEETPEDCLHDCGGCEPDGLCDDAFETPLACPADCVATSCNFDGEVDPLEEQCDDGNHFNDDACTDTCQLNVCGDGLLNPEAEECDDGNLDEADGCNNNCEQALRLIFLSSEIYQADLKPKIGQLSGLALADAHCKELSDAADLPGTYMAWLSGDVDAASPSKRFGIKHTYAARYELVDGTILATSWIDLRLGTIDNPINVLADGTKNNGSSWVWTNTMAGGDSIGMLNCKQWTTNDPEGIGGFSGKSNATNEEWTHATTRSCASYQRLYCVQVSE